MAAVALLVCAQIALASHQSAFTGRPFTPATRPEPSNQPRYPGKPGTTSPWLQLTNAPPSGFVPGSMMVMTDGTVLIHQDNTGIWEKLTPSSTGSYVNGTWSAVASLPSGYQPLYYASQILATGQLLVDGGEYNGSSTGVSTTQGAIYSPVTNTWASVSPPPTWLNTGDAQSVMLPTATGNVWTSGQFMMAHPFPDGSGNTGLDDALYNSNGTWTRIPGTGKLDGNDEEGWTLLSNDRVLTVDIAHNWDGISGHACSPCTSELFNPATDTWSATGNIPVDLPSYVGPNGPSQEMGPVVMQPNGMAFAIGGNDATASYNSSTGVWTAGPTLANNQDSADGAASILPDGGVLFDASPGVFNAPTHFFVWNGSTITQVTDTTKAPSDSSYVTRFVVLPTGQVMFDDGTGDIEIYNGDQTFNSSWEPTITSISSSTLTRGSTFSLAGTQLSGRSDGAAYGDDNQSATNYPLVRITNNATHVVTYARTSGFSYAIASGAQSATSFTLPASTPTGASTLQVVANGIPSAGQAVTITAVATVASFTTSPSPATIGTPVTFDASSSTCAAAPCTYAWSDGSSKLGTGTPLTFTFHYVGTKHVLLTLTDARGSKSMVEHDLTVTAATTTARFTTSPSPATIGTPVTFDASSSTCAAAPCTYAWSDGSSKLGTGTPLTFTFHYVGTKHVLLTLTDARGSKSTVEHDLTIS